MNVCNTMKELVSISLGLECVGLEIQCLKGDTFGSSIDVHFQRTRIHITSLTDGTYEMKLYDNLTPGKLPHQAGKIKEFSCYAELRKCFIEATRAIQNKAAQ